jgi:hypothetical protein
MLVAMVSPALAGCPTVDLGETPPDPSTCNADFVYYEQVIWPEYLAPPTASESCVGETACHRIEDGRSALRLETTDPIDHEANFTVVLRFVNCGSPDQSSLLTKPVSAVDPHGGGDLFPQSGPQVDVFLGWFP